MFCWNDQLPRNENWVQVSGCIQEDAREKIYFVRETDARKKTENYG